MFFESVLMCGHQDESLLAHVSQLTPVLPLTQTPALKSPSHLTVAHSISPAPEGIIACAVEQNHKNKDDHKKTQHLLLKLTRLCRLQYFVIPQLCVL